MLKCIAIDDEPLALNLLADNISRVPYLELIGSCDDALQAVKLLQEKTVDLVFVDIQMPGLTGLQFLKSLTRRPLAILITAYKQYALDSYDLDVVDYLVKPVAFDRFLKACNKAKEIHDLRVFKQDNRTSPALEFFFVSVDYSKIKVRFDDIEWIEALRDYILIHLKSSKKPLMVRSSLKSVETELPKSQFVRIHKSYIVSINSITAVRKSNIFIQENELPVGDNYQDVVGRLTGSEGS